MFEAALAALLSYTPAGHVQRASHVSFSVSITLVIFLLKSQKARFETSFAEQGKTAMLTGVKKGTCSGCGVRQGE